MIKVHQSFWACLIYSPSFSKWNSPIRRRNSNWNVAAWKTRLKNSLEIRWTFARLGFYFLLVNKPCVTCLNYTLKTCCMCEINLQCVDCIVLVAMSPFGSIGHECAQCISTYPSTMPGNRKAARMTHSEIVRNKPIQDLSTFAWTFVSDSDLTTSSSHKLSSSCPQLGIPP